MSETDLFYKPPKVIKPVITRFKTKAELKEELNRKVLKTEKELFEDNVEDVVVVIPPTSTERTRVKYSVSQTVNKRFLISLEILEKLSPYVREIGCTRSEYERNILSPLRKLLKGRVMPKSKKPKSKSELESRAEPKEGDVNVSSRYVHKLSSFEKPRKVKETFNKVYNKLEKEGVDLSAISYSNGEVSLLDSAKLVRLYFSKHDLKDTGRNRHFSPDNFIKEIFGDKLDSLYEKNGTNLISQGQLQTLATWLVGDIVKD
jgi:hypothetical protein